MKSVLVTGGTIRLGRAIADALRAAGWRVITASHRPDSGADIVADFADSMGPARCYAAAMKLLGGNPPDALVNNAALFRGERQLLESVNLEAPRKLTMMMAGRENGRGSVVNIVDSRILGLSPSVASDSGDEGAYRETKSSLLAWTRQAAMMFADTLNVNAVAPGPVLAPTGVRELAGETPAGRPKPSDVAAAVLFLLEARATTGAVLPVDGGQHLC